MAFFASIRNVFLKTRPRPLNALARVATEVTQILKTLAMGNGNHVMRFRLAG